MILLAMLLSTSPALAQDSLPEVLPESDQVDALPEPEAWEKVGWGWGGLPYVVYNSDEGFNFGLIGSIYRYDGKTKPYRTAIGFNPSFTTKGVLWERVDIDALGLAGGKLRVTARAVFDSRFTEPYCGVGGDVKCDQETADAQMDQYGVPAERSDEDYRRWFFAGYRQPFIEGWARYQLSPMPHRVELLANARVSYLAPFDRYEHTLYSYERPEEDERGLTSVLQAGIMLDNRDNEPSPFSGYWVEATVRGATPYWGSQFTFFGFNTTLRGYLPVLKEGRLTVADRFAFDGLVGDTNMKELDWMGGYQPYNGVGGARSLRGIRQDRYRGKVKMINQLELRWRFARWKPGPTVDWYLQPFLDVGKVGEEWEDFGPTPFQTGQGLGLRVAFNQNFILRGDFATAKVEGWGLSGLYLATENIF